MGVGREVLGGVPAGRGWSTLRSGFGMRGDGGMKGGEVLNRAVLTVPAEAPLREAMASMVRGRVSGLPVVSGERLVGILTEGDVVRRLHHQVPWFASFV